MNTDLREKFNNKKCILLGAGVSNMPLAEMLTSLGARIEIRDKKTEQELGERAAELKALGAKLVLGDDYLKPMRADYIFRSPGFRPDIPVLQEARSAGCTVTAEMDMFLEFAPCKVIGITGSDGKSTTTTITAKILEAENAPNRKVFLGGNIGEPLLHRVAEMREGDVVSAELSSFQLMSVTAPVSVGVIKNVTPNHLNWHTGMDEYIAAKARILKGCERAVLNYDDEVCRSLAKECEAPITWFSRHAIPEEFLKAHEGGVYAQNGKIVRYESKTGKVSNIMDASDILLPGEHNLENYCTAIAATLGLASREAVIRVAETFGGVRHRLELVRVYKDVRYYNSSIDSSPTRTAAAISALSGNIRIICGGYDKNIPFEPLARALAEHKGIKTVVLTGATAKKIEAALNNEEGFDKSRIEVVTKPDFREAVLCAASRAEKGDAVLLSPACASFDAFENFEKRGEYFCSIVEGIE